MPFYYLLVLALVQGITEFLPVSSSGHLVLVHKAFNPDELQNWQSHMALDIAVHVGTLMSVLLYFRKDVANMFSGLKQLAGGKLDHDGSRLIVYLMAASIPVIVAGFALHIWQPEWLLMVEVVGWTTIIFGILLGFADRVKREDKTLENLTLKDSLIIGFSQALALVPGTSRSGITMTMSRFLGYSRSESAHFSLLLAIIAITGAGLLGIKDIVQAGDMQLGLDFIIAAAISFVAGYISITLMMKWLERSTFMPFVIYRLILGTVLLAFVYWPS